MHFQDILNIYIYKETFPFPYRINIMNKAWVQNKTICSVRIKFN